MQAEENKKISSAVIRRLPRYYRYLGELIESGVQRISSKDLSVRMKDILNFMVLRRMIIVIMI